MEMYLVSSDCDLPNAINSNFNALSVSQKSEELVTRLNATPAIVLKEKMLFWLKSCAQKPENGDLLCRMHELLSITDNKINDAIQYQKDTAVTLMQQMRYEEAENLVTKALESRPESTQMRAKLLRSRSLARAKQSKLEDALRDAKKALQYDVRSGLVLKKNFAILGFIYTRLKKFVKAEKYLLDGLQEFPDDFTILYYLRNCKRCKLRDQNFRMSLLHHCNYNLPAAGDVSPLLYHSDKEGLCSFENEIKEPAKLEIKDCLLSVDFGATRTKFMLIFADSTWVLEAVKSDAIWNSPTAAPASLAEYVINQLSSYYDADLKKVSKLIISTPGMPIISPNWRVNGLHVASRLPSIGTGNVYNNFDFRQEFSKHSLFENSDISIVWDGLASVLGAKYKYQARSGLVLTLGTSPSAGTFMTKGDDMFEVGAFQNWVWFETIPISDGILPQRTLYVDDSTAHENPLALEKALLQYSSCNNTSVNSVCPIKIGPYCSPSAGLDSPVPRRQRNVFMRWALDSESWQQILQQSVKRKHAKKVWQTRVSAALSQLLQLFQKRYNQYPEVIFVLGGNGQLCKGHSFTFSCAPRTRVIIPETDDEVQFVHTIGGVYWSSLKVLEIQNFGSDIFGRGWSTEGQIFSFKHKTSSIFNKQFSM